MNLFDLIAEQVEKIPHNIAFGAPDRLPLTYVQLKEQIQDTVDRLNGLGIGRNDPVAIVLPNGPEMASAFISIASGATSAPLNPNYQSPEFDFYLTDLQAKALVILKDLDSPAIEVARNRKIPIIKLIPDINGPAGRFSLEGELQELKTFPGFAEAEDVALVLHTSGTTSRPKIVPLRQRNLLATAQNIRSSLRLTDQDRCLNVMPLFHIHGLMAAVLSSLSAGASVICTPGFYVTDFFPWLDNFKPTWYTAVPTMHQAILARSEGHQDVLERAQLRFVRSCSASLAPQVMGQLQDTFKAPVIEAYGMTEASHQMSCNPLPPGVQKPGSVGLPTGVEVEIMDENDPEFLTTGELGEIVIRGPNVTDGYANNPEANRKAFTDGWFRTGDQGYKDADGYIYLTGRLKEIINRGGEKISPREIDEILLGHSAVLQALTFGMPHPALGEEVAAAVVLDDETVTERDVRQFAAQHLVDYKVPRRVVILDEIPKGPTGKLQRIGLAEKLGISAEPAKKVYREYVAPRDRLEESLVRIWQQVLDVPQVGVFDRFIELGGDSMLATRLVMRVSQELGVRVNLTDFSDTPTVAEQAEFLSTLDVELEESPTLPGPELITAINTQGGLPPIFFMSAATSDSFIFSGLSKGLGLDRPLYGLTPYKLALEGVEDQVGILAERYLGEIKQIQPEGPYYLGGNCSGGIVAYEIAGRLIAQGQAVNTLIMTESYGLDYPRREGSFRHVGGLLRFFDLILKHLDTLSVSSSLGKRVYLSNLWRRQWRRAVNLVRKFLGLEKILAPESQRAYDFRAGENYFPQPIDCNALLLRAKHQPTGIQKDDTLGWGTLVRGELTVVEVPGYHGGLYPGSRSVALGELIASHLAR